MKHLTLLLLVFLSFSVYAQKVELKSPNGEIKIGIDMKDQISYSVIYGNDTLLKNCNLSLELEKETLGAKPIFKNKKAAKLLNFFKIMPAFRMRDGVENLGKNSEVFNRCVEVLNKNKALGIMPEGNQEIERKIRPLVKGIFRIAFAAQQKQGSSPNVKIIPVGLDFGNIEKFGKHIIINIGQPIEVSDYMAEYEINPALATNQIRERLSAKLAELSLNLASEKYYNCFETSSEIAITAYLVEHNLPNNTESHFFAQQKIAEKLVQVELNEPTKMVLINSLYVDYKNTLEELNLKRVYRCLILLRHCELIRIEIEGTSGYENGNFCG